jgi:hypothetical protein
MLRAYACGVGILGWIVIGVAVLAIVGVVLYLVRQSRMYGPPPSDLRRAGDGSREDYSTFEEGHDIATGFVERGGSF